MEFELASINQKRGVTVKDVQAKEFIAEFAAHLKRNNSIRVPEWSTYVKTACFKELAPYDKDWIFTRAASVAYQLYMRGNTGVNTLRKHYSEGQRNGTCPKKTRLSAGKVIRYCLKELQNHELVGEQRYSEDNQIFGKVLTKKGTTDMDRIASKIIKSKKNKKQ